jgi:hypothetical protein
MSPLEGKFRQEEMDQEYGTQFQTRVVRDVAPGKVVARRGMCQFFHYAPAVESHVRRLRLA